MKTLKSFHRVILGRAHTSSLIRGLMRLKCPNPILTLGEMLLKIPKIIHSMSCPLRHFMCAIFSPGYRLAKKKKKKKAELLMFIIFLACLTYSWLWLEIR